MILQDVIVDDDYSAFGNGPAWKGHLCATRNYLSTTPATCPEFEFGGPIEFHHGGTNHKTTTLAGLAFRIVDSDGLDRLAQAHLVS